MLAQIETESLPLNYHFLCIQEKKNKEVLTYCNYEHCSGRTSHCNPTKDIIKTMDKCKWDMFLQILWYFQYEKLRKGN